MIVNVYQHLFRNEDLTPKAPGITLAFRHSAFDFETKLTKDEALQLAEDIKESVKKFKNWEYCLSNPTKEQLEEIVKREKKE